MSRIPRAVLAPVGAVAVLAFLIGAGYGLQAIFGAGTPAPLPTYGQVQQPAQNGSPNPIVAENAKPGTTAWRITNVAGSAGIEGYADHNSAAQGDTVTLFVSTSAAHFTVQAYRMGYYGGLGGRLVWTSPTEPGVQQAPATVQAGTNMASAGWKASLSVPIDASWTPGDYLLKLVGDGGQQRYIPLTVVDLSSPAPLVIVNAVATWEAFNDWGGYNLYYGPTQAAANRSTVVSFDRPYASAGSGDESGDGSGDFLGDEFPLVYFAESYGFDVTYVTDIDLDEHGAQLLAGRSGVITLGHDEYWSAAMRTAVTGAETHGTNLAFLGANAMYQQIRFQSSPLGPDRQIVDYKNATADPVAATTPTAATVPWRDPPVNDAESSVIGELFECNPATPAPAVVVDASNWLFADTGIRNGDTFANLIGPYYDRVNPAFTTPANVEVLAHSPVTCQKLQSHADMTYYSAPSGAGVFASGTTGWVCELTASCLQDPRPHPDERILQITKNLLGTFAAGPAGTAHPSKANLAALGIAIKSP